MEKKRIQRATITPGHDITVVIANRFNSLEEFGAGEPNYLGTIISQGELPWLLNFYKEKAEAARVKRVADSPRSIKAIAKVTPAKRVTIPAPIDGMEEKPAKRPFKVHAERSNGRGAQFYDFTAPDLFIDLTDAVKARKVGQVTMKVHVPHNSDIVPFFFNTSSRNVGKKASHKAEVDMKSSARKAYVCELRDMDVEVLSSKVSVCRALKNKRGVKRA